MTRPHATGSGPAIGERVSLTHETSGSVLHGVVQLCPTVGLFVDVDGRIFDMDRAGWHVTSADVEPPVGAVVVDKDGDAWQHRFDGRWYMAGFADGYLWGHLLMLSPELIHEPKP